MAASSVGELHDGRAGRVEQHEDGAVEPVGAHPRQGVEKALLGLHPILAEHARDTEAADLDLDRVFESISGGAAGSWQMSNRWATMVKDEFDFGFAIDWMRKDLGLAFEEARANGATLPVAALVDQFYAEVQAMGGGRQDTSALVRRLKKV